MTTKLPDFAGIAQAIIGSLTPCSADDYRRHVFKTHVCERLSDCGFDRRFHFDGLPPSATAQERVFLATLRGLRRAGAVIVLCGARGLGKTTIAAQVAVKWFWEDWDSRFTGGVVTHRIVVYRKLAALLGKLKALYADFGTTSGEKLESYRDHLASVDVLVVDELNECGDDSKFKDKILTDIIDRRYSDMRDTVLITNQTPDDFRRVTNASILSRLTEHGTIIECDWPSFRGMPVADEAERQRIARLWREKNTSEQSAQLPAT